MVQGVNSTDQGGSRIRRAIDSVEDSREYGQVASFLHSSKGQAVVVVVLLAIVTCLALDAAGVL